MRPIAEAHSALRAPVNHILGTEGNVRIVRLLTSTSTPLTRAEVARRTRLNTSGVGRAVAQLTGLGIVESLGAGSRRLVRLRKEHPLASPLANLFAAERARFESIIEGLRVSVERLEPPPRAAWIEGPVATESDKPADPVLVGVLDRANRVDQAVEQLRASLAELEHEYDVTIAIRSVTSADLAVLSANQRADLEGTIPLLGPPPDALLADPRSAGADGRSRSHEDLDRRALAMARAISKRLSDDPSLVERAQQYVSGRLEKASPGERMELREWERLLRTMSLPRLQRFLVDPGERATRLRQTLPFVDALSRKERDAILKECAVDKG